MFIEQPPFLYRMLYPKLLWRLPTKEKSVYLTFDDGPIPEVTPWVLDLLDKQEVKATFFCVGENVMRHPELYEEIVKRGHRTGNHTMNHLKGIRCNIKSYLRNVEAARQWISGSLFRPPHGQLRFRQSYRLRKQYKIVMWDVVTRDYSKKLSGEEVLRNVRKYVRNGSIIVFHDSLKGEKNLRYALPKAIPWLKDQGYRFALLP